MIGRHQNLTTAFKWNCQEWQKLNAALDSGLFQDGIGGEFGDDCHRYGEALAGDWAVPYFMAPFALSNKSTAVSKQEAAQLRIEGVAHELQRNPAAGCLVLLETDAQCLRAYINAVFFGDFRGDFPYALGQSLVGFAFGGQSDVVAHGDPHVSFGVVGYMHNEHLVKTGFEGSVHSSEAYNKFKLLTNTAAWVYSSHITAKSVVRLGILEEAAIGRKVLCNAAFLLSQCAHDLWAGWAGAARPPVRFTGIPTCSVPPTRLESGSGSFNELEHIS